MRESREGYVPLRSIAGRFLAFTTKRNVNNVCECSRITKFRGRI